MLPVERVKHLQIPCNMILFGYMIKLRPSYHVGSIVELSPTTIRQKYPNLEGFGWDLDGILIGYDELIVPNNHVAKLKEFTECGFEQGILCNASSPKRARRVKEIAEHISERIDYDLVVVTSSMDGVSKKPSITGFNELAAKLSVHGSNMGFGGDQLFKDILGANRAEYGLTVLVAPFGEGDDWRVRYLQRPAEAVVRLALRLPFNPEDFSERSNFSSI